MVGRKYTMLSRTDSIRLVKLLESMADIIDRKCAKPSEQDKARQAVWFARKIARKLDKQ